MEVWQKAGFGFPDQTDRRLVISKATLAGRPADGAVLVDWA
jgi:hypothetical protein